MSSPTPGRHSSYFPARFNISRYRQASLAMASSSPFPSLHRPLLGPPPLSLNRYSSSTPARQTSEDLPFLRYDSSMRLLSAFESIADKYKDVNPDEDDEIDLRTGEIVVDRGRLRALAPREFGDGDDEADVDEVEEPQASIRDPFLACDNDEDELGGWGESSGLDLQVLDLSRIKEAASARRTWTDADQEDLNSFLRAEEQRAAAACSRPPAVQSSVVERTSTRAVSTPASIRMRRTVYSGKAEGFFPSSEFGEDSEDELNASWNENLDDVMRQRPAAASVPSLLPVQQNPPRFTTDIEQGFLSSSPSTSCMPFASLRARSQRIDSLSYKARGKLPMRERSCGTARSHSDIPDTQLGMLGTSSTRPRQSSSSRVESTIADHSEAGFYSSVPPSTQTSEWIRPMQRTPISPSAGRRKALTTPNGRLPLKSGHSKSSLREPNGLSVRFSPVVTNIPISVASGGLSHTVCENSPTLSPVGNPSLQINSSRPLTPYEPTHTSREEQANSRQARDSTSPEGLKGTADERLCPQCMAAGGYREHGAASCSGSTVGVECELAVAGRTAERNRLARAQPITLPRIQGVRKRMRVVLSPDESEDDAINVEPFLAALADSVEATTQPIVSMPAKSWTESKTVSLSKPLVPSQRLARSEDDRRRKSLRRTIRPSTQSSPTARISSAPQTLLVTTGDESEDELALTDEISTQANMVPKPHAIAAFIRQQSLRLQSPAAECLHPSAIGLPTPPPSFSSTRSTRTPRPMPPPLRPASRCSPAVGPSCKRQCRQQYLGPGQLSTPAPSLSPAPTRTARRTLSSPVVKGNSRGRSKSRAPLVTPPKTPGQIRLELEFAKAVALPPRPHEEWGMDLDAEGHSGFWREASVMVRL